MTDFIPYITDFLSEKKLAQNSRKSYQYDLEQFLQEIKGTPDDYSLRLYQEKLSDLKPSAQKRKLSSVNQFLYYLYEKGHLDRFYKLKVAKKPLAQTRVSTLLELDCLYHETDDLTGQLIALLILELGLTPSEIAELQVSKIDKEFQIITLKKSGAVRILAISEKLLPYLNWETNQKYLFENSGKPYTRQWFFTKLSHYLKSLDLVELTAQKLREQYMLREQAAGVPILELAKKLGLKNTTTLEKYYKHGH
ncbi:site-specific tyrosine recombinase XerD [Streptococcus hillyeri]|uniref:Tyrosine recombinase XerD-like n=1 Tax=Streptococcus hillyeri TaxID=2282420 RepID=A0A3L9DLA3_9STRE|nr:site-specific tyrosine recombinase XerD [Streptococcus hillyeri]RLY01785.1 site-specific tyrosine recombinase XerD [Streptococcus hillyeri]